MTPGPAERQHRHPHDLPPGGAEGERAPRCATLGTWRKTSRLTAETIGKDHDGEHDGGVEDRSCRRGPVGPDVEEREPAEVVGEPGGQPDHLRDEEGSPHRP